MGNAGRGAIQIEENAKSTSDFRAGLAPAGNTKVQKKGNFSRGRVKRICGRDKKEGETEW